MAEPGGGHGGGPLLRRPGALRSGRGTLEPGGLGGFARFLEAAALQNGQLREPLHATERGPLLESWALHEVRAHLRDHDVGGELAYWRLPSGMEVDLVWQRVVVYLGDRRLKDKDVDVLLFWEFVGELGELLPA